MCREDGYFYYTRTLEGKQYSVHARRRAPASLGAPTGKVIPSYLQRALQTVPCARSAF